MSILADIFSIPFMRLLFFILLIIVAIILFIVIFFMIPAFLFRRDYMKKTSCRLIKIAQGWYRKIFFSLLSRCLDRKGRTHPKLSVNLFLRYLTLKNKDILGAMRICFNYSYPLEHTPSASISCDSPQPAVYLNMGWLILLMYKPDELTRNAFRTSLGHEMSHLGDFPYKGYYCKCRKFIRYVNEVYADFNGILLGVNGSLSEGLRCMQFKYDRGGFYSRHISDRSHPSWKKRMQYVRKFEKFDEKLIEQIAKDTGCKNKKVISAVIQHFHGNIITLV